MKHRIFVIRFAVFLLLCSCSGTAPVNDLDTSDPVAAIKASASPPNPATEKLVKWLGSAKSIKSYRVEGLDSESKSKKRIDKFPVIADGPTLTKEQRAALGKILSKEGSLAKEGKFCEFDPGIALVAHKDKETVNILICLKCDQIEITGAIKEPVSDIDAVSEDFRALAKSLFPKENFNRKD